MFNATKRKDERVGHLLTVRGKAQEPVDQVVAGDIGAVAKLADTSTGDTLTAKAAPVGYRPRRCPTRCCRSPSPPSPAATRRSSPRAWPGPRPRT